MGPALIILGLVMRKRAFGRAVTAFGIIAGVLRILAAYPWLIGPLLTTAIHTVFARWLMLVGTTLRRGGRSSRPAE